MSELEDDNSDIICKNNYSFFKKDEAFFKRILNRTVNNPVVILNNKGGKGLAFSIIRNSG